MTITHPRALTAIALGLFGGLGSRARKGLGSLALQKIERPGQPIREFTSIESIAAFIQTLGGRKRARGMAGSRSLSSPLVTVPEWQLSEIKSTRTPAARWAKRAAISSSRSTLPEPMSQGHRPSSRPSGSMMTDSVGSPEGCAARRASTAMTLPEVGAWTAAETHLSASPMRCPLRTLSPALTSGCGVPPMLWCSGTINCAGIGAVPIAACSEGALWVSGLTPPLNLKSCNIRALA